MENWMLDEEAFEILCECIDLEMVEAHELLMAEIQADTIAELEAQEYMANL